MTLVRLLIMSTFGLFLVACGGEEETKPVAVSAPQPKKEVVTTPSGKELVQTSVGGVSVTLRPENPTSSDCLMAVVKGQPGNVSIIWKVNDEVVSSGTSYQLCTEHYVRDDTVSVQVGTFDQGATASVSIENTPPRIVDITATTGGIVAGKDVTISPVAEDIDGDEISYSYQWFINGEERVEYTDATLPGSAFRKGDRIKVLIVPNDFYADGEPYESYEHQVENAPPEIVSQPPEGISSLDYRYQVEVTDPDDSQFTYRLDEAPEGMTIDPASGLISWSLAGVEPGEYTVAIIVTDPEGLEGAQEYSLALGEPE